MACIPIDQRESYANTGGDWLDAAWAIARSGDELQVDEDSGTWLLFRRVLLGQRLMIASGTIKEREYQ